MRLALLSFATVFVVLSGCAAGASSLPTSSLPTLATWNGGCRGVGVKAKLTGSPTDPRIAWLTGVDGQRMDVVWPPGYTARFTPQLEVLDPNGSVVFREGSTVTGGCVTGPDAKGPLLVAAGF